LFAVGVWIFFFEFDEVRRVVEGSDLVLNQLRQLVEKAAIAVETR